MLEKSISDFVILMATIDPVSSLALFLGLTAGMSDKERARTAVRSVVYSGAILTGFIVLGQLLMGSLGIRLAAFQMAGGIVFFLFGVQMIFGTGAIAERPSAEPGHDVAVFPLAVPSIAGPGGILAVVILTDNREYSIAQQMVTTALLVVVLGITLVAMLLAQRIHRVLGASGASLLVRLLGMLLTALAVEMILEAALELVEDFGAGPI